jgi:hypothetical protein
MDQRRVNAVAANTFVTNPNLRQSVNFKDDALRPYYGWGSLNAVETLAYSRYDALMFRLSRRFANNLAVNFNYTRSSAMDLLDNDSDNITNPFNMRQNWGKAGYDQPNVLPPTSATTPEGEARWITPGETGVEWLGSHRHLPRPIGNADLIGAKVPRWCGSGSQYADLVGDPMRDRTSINRSTPRHLDVPRRANTATFRGMRSACRESATWTPA